jgi:hypothetical protein
MGEGTSEIQHVIISRQIGCAGYAKKGPASNFSQFETASLSPFSGYEMFKGVRKSSGPIP